MLMVLLCGDPSKLLFVFWHTYGTTGQLCELDDLDRFKYSTQMFYNVQPFDICVFIVHHIGAKGVLCAPEILHQKSRAVHEEEQ